jgi:four helix bundle protein
MPSYTTHRELIAWQQAMLLAETVYRGTVHFPKDEMFGLTRQIKNSAISVPSNIAEGCARNSLAEYVHFLGIACGSMAELETQLELAVRLRMLEPNTILLKQADRTARLLRALRKSLRAKMRDTSEKAQGA